MSYEQEIIREYKGEIAIDFESVLYTVREADKEITELKQQYIGEAEKAMYLEEKNQELKAHCVSLAVENHFILKNANYALSIAPATAQLLKEIQADAIEACLKEVGSDLHSGEKWLSTTSARNYIKKLKGEEGD